MIVAHDISHGLNANQQVRADGLRRRDTPDLKGVYFVGAGISAALKVLDGIPRERWPIIVCHELTPVTRGALAAGTVGVVLDSPRRELARELVDRMIEASSGRAAQRDHSPVEFRFYCPENVV